MKTRMVILSIDDIMRLFADYCLEEDIPGDTTAVALMRHPTDPRIAILAESDQWPTGTTEPVIVKFDIRRLFSVGESA